MTVSQIRHRKRKLAVVTVVALVVIIFIHGPHGNVSPDPASVPLTYDAMMEFMEGKHERHETDSFFIQPKTGCSSVGVSDLHVVIIVVSKDSNTGQRLAIRQTWGNKDLQQKHGVRIYFLVGKGKHQDIGEENEMFGDIVQADVAEGYYKITEKTVAVFQWVTQFCPNARYLFKCDDDILLNIARLMNIVTQGDFTHGLIAGRCVMEGTPSRLYTKWAVSYKEYPFRNHPPHCTGPGYVMTMKTAMLIFNEMTNTRPYMFEDIFVGMVAYKLDILIRNIEHFGYDYQDDRATYYQLFILYFYPECVVLQHKISAGDLKHIWQKNSAYLDNSARDRC